eukprot:CAMPEP_0175314444 /NCGR_PEP_ID=MMETSP0093-20121207/68398_1 /TAXON_ID=311494 /ORGANISM="Alexandrium monilatum, Strain CCMP3105" /LENGTH=140 /DNA_ID=CAMNT_0016611173 /DNA_START=34 /DNA_END=456 /DNA_ORIENTATION=-
MLRDYASLASLASTPLGVAATGTGTPTTVATTLAAGSWTGIPEVASGTSMTWPEATPRMPRTVTACAAGAGGGACVLLPRVVVAPDPQRQEQGSPRKSDYRDDDQHGGTALIPRPCALGCCCTLGPSRVPAHAMEHDPSE